MAIHKLPSGKYQIDFRDNAGVRHRESYDRQKDAQAALDAKRTAVRHNEYTTPKKVPTFKEAAERWLKGKQTNASKHGTRCKETSLQHWRVELDHYLIPTLGHLRLDQIDVALIEAKRDLWATMGERKRSASSVNAILVTASAVFNEAMRLGQTRNNPAKLAKRLGVGSVEYNEGENDDGTTTVREEEVYNIEELKRLIDAARPGFERAFIMTAAFTGIRVGEALALQWGDLDKTGKLLVRRSWPQLKDSTGEPVFYIPKTKNATREIPVSDELMLELKKWKLQCPVSKYELIFPSPDGRPYTRQSVAFKVKRAQSKAGVKQLHVHGLRHTFASLLLSRGTPPTEVAAYLGHSNAHITMTVYAHWLPKTKTDSISRLVGAVLNRGHFLDTLEVEENERRVSSDA